MIIWYPLINLLKAYSKRNSNGDTGNITFKIWIIIVLGKHLLAVLVGMLRQQKKWRAYRLQRKKQHCHLVSNNINVYIENSEHRYYIRYNKWVKC